MLERARAFAGTAAALAFFGGLLAACASAPPSSAASPAEAPGVEGRSRCPGSVPVALTNLDGPAADLLEQLQGRYEERAGFMAVVFDGINAIVVVEAGRLAAWRAELDPQGIAVATSCVDPVLLAAVQAAVPGITPPGGTSSAGYNAVDDSIDVSGVGEERLLAALDGLDPEIGARAREAIARGTLRIDADAGPVTRTSGVAGRGCLPIGDRTA